MVRLFAGSSCLARRLLIVFLTMFCLMKVRSLSIFFMKSGRQKVAAKLLFGRGRPFSASLIIVLWLSAKIVRIDDKSMQLCQNSYNPKTNILWYRANPKVTSED